VLIKRVATAMALVLGMAVAAGPGASAATGAAPSTEAGQAETIEGVLRLVATDPVPGAAEREDQFLVVGDRSYVLTGVQGAPNTRVRVTGIRSGTAIAATAIEDLGPTHDEIPPIGTTRVLVMLGHWSAPDGVTPQIADEAFFGDGDAWYDDASYGALGQVGDVTPWFEIDGPVDGKCYGDAANTMAQAKAAATALGYDLADYDNYVLYSPNNAWQEGSDCDGFAGWAYVGTHDLWLNGYIDRRVIVHEEGHNYGLSHSHSYLCDHVVYGACTFTEYGDDFDAMGASGLVGHFSASQKNRLGWMTGRKVDLSSGGTAVLAPMAKDALAVSVASIRASATRTYWLEYRQAIDFDGALPAQATNGVLLHMEDAGVGAGAPNLLDTRPGDGLSTGSATIRPGESWTTPEGFTFAVTAATPTGASVAVTGGPTCPDTAIEPDDTMAQARLLSLPADERHAFCKPNDKDWVKFTTTAVSTVRMESLNLGVGTDTVFDLYDSAGTKLASNDDVDGTRASRIDFVAEVDGTYFLRTRQADGRSGIGLWYDLRITELDLTAPTVIATTPRAGQHGVGKYAIAIATFDEPVVGISLSTFTMTNARTGAVVTAGIYQRQKPNTWALDPTVVLKPGRHYLVTLTGGPTAIRDLVGNPLETMSWRFTIKHRS
jgi:hypothetical protein